MDRAHTTLTAGQVLHILLVEDDDADASSVEHALSDAGFAYTLERARTERDFRTLLSGRFDIVIADWHFSSSDGVRASELMRQRDIDVPLVFISDHPGGNKNLLSREPYLIQVLKDISLRKEEEHKRHVGEMRLARARRAQQALLECNRAAAYQQHEQQLLDEVCRILVTSGGYVQAWIGLAVHDARRTVVPAASAGFDDMLQHTHCSWGAAAGGSIMGGVIASGSAHVARDILNDAKSIHRRDRARERGFQASLTLPLHLDGVCIGGLAVYAQEPDAYEQEEMDLIATLAKDLAYGIGTLRKEAARREAESQLARVLRARRVMAECMHAIIHATDEPALLREMCRVMVESGGYVQAWIGFGTGSAKRPVRAAAHAGFGRDEPMGNPRSWDERGQYRGPMGRVIASGEPVIARDIRHNPAEASRRARAAQLGYQSSIIVPLVSEGHVLGAMSIHARERDAFDDEEIKLVTELAGDLAFGITALRTRVAREYAERQLRMSEHRYRETFNQAAVGITRVDLDGVLTDVNQKFCDMLGYTRQELIGRTGRDITHPEDYGTGARLRLAAARGGPRYGVNEKRYLRKDGRAIWVRRTKSIAQDDEGRARYIINIVEDISARKRIEQDLRTNIERFEAVSRATNDAVWDWDLQTGKLWWNDGFLALFGYRSDQIDGTVDTWCRYVHDDDRARVVDGIHDVIDGGGIYWTDEYRFRRADGSDAHIYDRGYVIRDDSGRALRMVGAMMDISERKRAEHAVQRTSQLNALLQALATAANEAVTPEQALLACLAHLSAFSGWVLGRVVMFGTTEADYKEQFSLWHGAENGRWAPFREACKPFSPLRKPGLINRVFETGQALWLEELPQDSASFRRAEAARACGLCSALAFPVIAAGRSYALIELYSDRPLPPDTALLEVMPHISGQLARVAERRLSENALLESERLARATMDALSQHICVVGEEGTIIAVNKSWRNFAELNGYSAGTAWAGENFFHVSDKATGMSAAEVAYVACGIRDVLTGAQDEFTTEYSCRANAEQRWFSVKATRFPGTGPKRAVISYENITDRALSHRRSAMEHAVTSVLAESASVSEAMPKLIRTMCEAMDWAYGALWSWGDEDPVLRRTEHWSETPLELEDADRGNWEELESGSAGGLLRRGLHRREATWIVDVQSDPTFKRLPSAQKLGFVSAYAFPIFAAGKVIGMMEFFGRDVRQPDEMLLLITRSVGSQIGQYVQRKEAEQALRVSEERFRVTISQAAVGITVTGLDLHHVMVNGKYAEIMGYAQEELLGLAVKDVVRPEDYEEALSFRRRMIQGESGTFDREKQLVRKDGSLVWVMVSTSLVRGKRGEPKHYISVIQDISDRKRVELALRESEEKFVQLSSNIPQAFWISDATLKEIIYMSPACESMLGVPVVALKRKPWLLVRAVHPDDRARVLHARKSAPAGDYDEIYRIVRPDGTVRWVQDRAFPVREGDGAVHRVAGIAEDITHRKEAEEKLLYLAHYDALTGLPNRNMFYDRLTQAMAQARRRNRLVAVMFLDLDRFKITNDTLGHSAGDDLLIQVARRLSDRVRVGDTVGRFGGDEFGLILSDLRSFEDGRAVAEKMMGAFEAPFLLERSEVYVSGSIGISMYPADSDDEGTLMKNADAAMYRAKEAGRNNFQFYTAEMNERALHRLDMENSLRRALERREFIFHYQPKVDLASGRITGMEALLRWQRPGRGMVQPVEFVPLLEDSGLIVSIGEWLLDAACMQIKAWERAGAAPVPVAINLSARQFASKDLGRTIQRVLDHHRIAPHLLQLELTESSLMTNTDDAVQTLRYLKSLGVHLSIDDFGTGYSSLAYLQLFPIDALKIDRSFVSDITSDVNDATIIRAVIGMAHNLGLKVVAEGVENEAQLSFLVANGCDEMQGFYYSPPLPGEDCTALLLDPPPLRLAAADGHAAAG